MQREHRMPSGVHPRVALDDSETSELGSIPPTLTSDFWDASPESFLPPDSYGRPASEFEAYDALDPEDLSAEWLTRATEAPATGDLEMYDSNDPAEIAADSMSMISDASRHAALEALDLETFEDADDRAVDSRG